LVVVFLGYELVEAGFGVEENRLEGKLGAVVGVEVEFGGLSAGEGSESGGEDGGGGCEAGVLQEFAAIGVRDVVVTRIRRTLFSTQTESPVGGAVVAKLTPGFMEGQGLDGLRRSRSLHFGRDDNPY